MKLLKRFQEGGGEEEENTHSLAHTHLTFLLFKFISPLHSIYTANFSSPVYF